MVSGVGRRDERRWWRRRDGSRNGAAHADNSQIRRWVVAEQWLGIDRHLAAIKSVIVINNVGFALVKGPNGPHILTWRGGRGSIRRSLERPLDRSVAWFSRGVAEVGKIALVVEISAKAGDALAGKDAEYLALVLGEFCPRLSAKSVSRQYRINITYRVGRLCRTPQDPLSGRLAPR